MNITDPDIRLGALRAKVRFPAVAGMFYPEEPRELARVVAGFTAAAAKFAAQPRILVVPHAGYIYSGAVAGRAYACLKKHSGTIRKVVLFGPAHRVYLNGLALPDADLLATPLGEIPVDKSMAKQVLQLPQVSINAEAHAQEHSLEVQLPFLQTVLEDFSILPLVVGMASIRDITEIFERLRHEKHLLIVISSDLSHYHGYKEAQRMDTATSAAIRSFNLDAIGPDQACGFVGLRGGLQFAHSNGMWVVELDLRNSGDTAGPQDRVVGYGAFAVYADRQFTELQKCQLLALARASIVEGLTNSRPVPINPDDLDPALLESGAAFVTLKIKGQLRGCIGTTQVEECLARCVAMNAYNAAFRDPRFEPLSADELPQIDISISVLTKPAPLQFSSETELLESIEPGIDGLIIESGAHRATFLPEVWDSLPMPGDFLKHLKIKAGISPSILPDKAWRYHAVHIE
ncbi:MAG: AmmeMemoRadiSam system protein B [Gammaproteobacteria bacterium]|nr:MAG: AmmeMemoRadiSam system protein B [Gammaproteobacteria bacterium]